ncbi:MAG: hypothetical protein ACREOK_09410 [Gemmatimonadaceae bacterium]
MTDNMDRTPEKLRAALREYNDPPELKTADLDAMWQAVESAAFEEQRATPIVVDRFSMARLLPLAATLVIGIGIGRFALPATEPVSPAMDVASLVTDSVSLQEPYHSTTSRYLGQAVALLASLPAEVREGRTNEPYMGRAHDLLLTTRLLMDSPAAAEPRFRTLLEDLELVLAQVVRLQSAESSEELELIRQALEQRDVLPRLRSAVANISADD